MHVTIFHNPRCSKSRQTLELLTEHGVEPDIVKYLETPPSPEELRDILAKLGIPAAELLRRGESEFAELGLADKLDDEAALLEAMSRHPKLIERPIVIVDGKARIGRPPESVLDIL